MKSLNHENLLFIRIKLISIFVILLSFILCSATGDTDNEYYNNYLNHIVHLTDENYKDVFTRSEIMLILFIEPNCLKCNRFMKNLLEVNEKVSKNKNELNTVLFATVEAFQDKKIAEELNIEKFPSFVYINKKFKFEEIITDLQNAEDLYTYLEHKLIRKWDLLTTIDQVSDFSVNKVNMVICVNENSERHKEYFSHIKNMTTIYEKANFFYVNIMKYRFEAYKLKKEYDGSHQFLNILKIC